MKRFLNTMVAVGVVAVSGACKKEAPPPAAPQVDAAAPAAPNAPTPRTIDLTDNAEVERVALASLKAYRVKDLAQLAELGPPDAKDKLIFLEDPRNPNRETLLGDTTWRMKSLQAWSGEKLKKISRGLDDVALGWYHEDDTHEYAVEVRKVGGKWTFFNLVQKDKVKPATPPQP